MDGFARDYSVFPAVAVLGLLVWAFCEDPQVAAQNQLPDRDAEIAANP